MYGMSLTERDRAIIDFERSWWSEPGRKELAIRERFDLSTTRYYGILNELLDAQPRSTTTRLSFAASAAYATADAAPASRAAR